MVFSSFVKKKTTEFVPQQTAVFQLLFRYIVVFIILRLCIIDYLSIKLFCLFIYLRVLLAVSISFLLIIL